MYQGVDLSGALAIGALAISCALMPGLVKSASNASRFESTDREESF